MDRQSPSRHGQRLLPRVIDEIAETEPEKIFAVIPRTFDLDDGFMNVTYSDFAKAIHRMSAWLEGKLGRSSSFETVAYIGPSDIGYFILAIAACKVGFKLLLPSPRNSLEGQLNLFKVTDCKTLFTTKDYNVAQELVDNMNLPLVYAPSLDQMMAGEEPIKYPFAKEWEEARSDPFVVLHTSGSTGLPKPIILRHAWPAVCDKINDMPLCNGFPSIFQILNQKRLMVTLPPFHAAGFALGLCLPVFINSQHCIWGPSNRIPSATVVDEILDRVEVDMLCAAPSVLEELINSPPSRKKLENLAAVWYGGGPLSREAGDKIHDKTAVINVIGSTEVCTMPLYSKDPEDWEYFHFSPSHKGVEFRDLGAGLFEQVLVRHPSTDDYHSTWWTFPDLKEYSLNDLYVKHPTKANLWRYVGRADDVIVLSNGEKLNPTSMEGTIRQHTDVKNALVVGQARFAPAVIVELTPGAAAEVSQSKKTASEIVNDIWPSVVVANKSAPAHAQISEDMIFFASPEKPFLLTPKGTTRRQAINILYSTEINDLYERSDEKAVADLPKIDVRADIGSLEVALAGLIRNAIKVENLDDDQDFFAAGMDSLHVMRINKQLKSALDGLSKDEITARLLYGNPTTRMLAVALKKLGQPNGSMNGKRESSAHAPREKVIKETLARFLKELPDKHAVKQSDLQGEAMTVILTGSTGSLGSYLLDTLILSSKVSKVYCLNRRPNAEEYQAEVNRSRGLISKWDRVEFFHVDLSKPSFGLEESLYERLRDETSAIIHNQWQVDFRLVLKSFERHIEGAVNLIRLSATSTKALPIFFVSSIGTVGQYGAINDGKAVPEIALEDPNSTLDQGYGESKWITERLLDAARTKSGVSAAIWRVGQIAGPMDASKPGMWNKQEFMPSMIASVPHLNVVPRLPPGQDDVNWIPVDVMSRIMVELVERESNMEGRWTKYYHLVNPNTARWDDLVPAIQEHFSKNSHGGRGAIEVVGITEWLKKLEESAKSNDADAKQNPAIKLLDFYRSLSQDSIMSKLDTKDTEEASKTMRELGPVGPDWMKLWLKQWNF